MTLLTVPLLTVVALLLHDAYRDHLPDLGLVARPWPAAPAAKACGSTP